MISRKPQRMPGARSTRLGAEPSEEAFVPFDVRPLLTPSRKYFGAALDGAPTSLSPVKEFTTKAGKQPNMLLYYTAWGDGFDARAVRNARAIGALPVMEWEPFEPSMADIADGASDDYITEFATAVQTLNLPIAISLAHEMNGFWYPWGTKKTSPADFVRAWRHIHNIFLDVGATNVIWVWSPNVINPMPQVRAQAPISRRLIRRLDRRDRLLRDWWSAAPSQHSLVQRRLRCVSSPASPSSFSRPGRRMARRKRKDIADLFRGVAASPDVIGFNWFNYAKRADWRIDSDPSALAQFRKSAKNDRFGFDLNHP